MSSVSSGVWRVIYRPVWFRKGQVLLQASHLSAPMFVCFQVLSFGSCDTEIPFLAEAEIPKDFSEAIEEKTQEQAEKSMSEAHRGGGELGGGVGAKQWNKEGDFRGKG